MGVSKDGWTLRLVRHGRSATVAATINEARLARATTQVQPVSPDSFRPSTVEPATLTRDVRSPLPGVVYLGPSPDAPPFVTVGQAVTTGATLCTVEAMKMFNAVTAEHDGVIEAIYVTTGDEVAAGQPLLRTV